MNAVVPTPGPGPAGASPLFQASDRGARFLDRHSILLLAVTILVVLIASLVHAQRENLWIDDLYTYYITQQPTVKDVVAAIREGCDGSPPLYALLVRPVQRVLGNNALALRLPSVLGAGLSAVFFFFFLRRRVAGIYAVAGVLAAAISAHWFATQARPYSLVLASVALALYSWQSAAEGRNRRWALLGLAFSLPFGIALHYYTVFVLLPLGCGELVRWRRTGKLDIPVAGIILASPLVLIPHLPLIQAAALFTKHPWSKASWSQAPTYYLDFGPWIFVGFGRAVALYLLVRMVAGAIGDRDSKIQPTPLYEIAACGVLALLPLILLVVSIYTTHFYLDRYACPAVFGLVAIFVFAAYRMTRGSRLFGAALFVTYLASFLVQYIAPALQHPSFLQAGPASTVLASAPDAPLPIAVANSHVFMELWYYAPPALRARLVYPVSTALDIRYTDIDTDARQFSALKHRSSIAISDYASFLESTPKFLYCHIGNHWMRAELIKAGYELTLLRASGAGPTRAELYRAERPALAASK